MPAAPVYAAAKAGVVHFTRSVARTLEKRAGIRVLAVCPEFVDTKLVRGVVDMGGGLAKALMGREVAEVPLLSPDQVNVLLYDHVNVLPCDLVPVYCIYMSPSSMYKNKYMIMMTIYLLALQYVFCSFLLKCQAREVFNQ